MSGYSRRVQFAARLSKSLREQFDKKVDKLKVKKGTTIVGQKEESADVFFILSGKFQVLVFAPCGKEVSLRQLGHGEMFGELSALGLGQRTATVIALSDGVLLRLKGEEFKALAMESSDAAFWLIQRLSIQVASLTNRVFELSALNVRNRVQAEIIRLAFQAGVAKGKACIDPSPTHQELANRLGTHREAVTKELRDLAARGLIKQERGAITVLDVDALSALLQRVEAGIELTLLAGR